MGNCGGKGSASKSMADIDAIESKMGKPRDDRALS